MTVQAVPHPAIRAARTARRSQSPGQRAAQRTLRHVVVALAAILLLAWTVFPFFWILLTSLKSPGDILSVP